VAIVLFVPEVPLRSRTTPTPEAAD
jgi:hypothetical protein